MNKFKNGDSVICINGSYIEMTNGDIKVISCIDKDDEMVNLVGHGDEWFSGERFKLYEDEPCNDECSEPDYEDEYYKLLIEREKQEDIITALLYYIRNA